MLWRQPLDTPRFLASMMLWRLVSGAAGRLDPATIGRLFADAGFVDVYTRPTLAGLGLLDDALALDMRKPQDYFHRIWSVAFRTADLAAHGGGEDTDEDVEEACA